MRRSLTRLCPTPPEHLKKAAAVFDIRRAPKSLHTADMHSNSLSDHPVTHRTEQNELAFKKRKLTERGEYERAAATEFEAAARDQQGRGGTDATEYRNVVIIMIVGYLTAHSVVYKWYYPDDVRFSYQPDIGYTEDVEQRREVLQRVDELVGFRVLDSVFDKKKASVKVPLT